jgi:hypothetical protein
MYLVQNRPPSLANPGTLPFHVHTTVLNQPVSHAIPIMNLMGCVGFTKIITVCSSQAERRNIDYKP